jgi:hypothetical protein
VSGYIGGIFRYKCGTGVMLSSGLGSENEFDFGGNIQVEFSRRLGSEKVGRVRSVSMLSRHHSCVNSLR